jgi:hypothetical protein
MNQLISIRISSLALDDFHRRNSVVEPEATQNSHDSFAGWTTLFFAVVKDAYAWIATDWTHVFDKDFADILKQSLIHSISRECRHKTVHSRQNPPVVRDFNLQSVVREFHQLKYARNSSSALIPISIGRVSTALVFKHPIS